MATRLTIKFEGDARGLREKRLSLADFGPAMAQLLKAYRRTASNLLQSATGGDINSATGRLHKQAELLDLEIEAIQGNSVEPSFVATQAPFEQQVALFGSLPEQALDRLILDIEAEASGRPQSHVARKYLTDLPAGVHRQTYSLFDGTRVLRSVTFAAPHLAELPVDLPRLLKLVGTVVGVGFVPGANYVDFGVPGVKQPISCSARPEHVDQALALRTGPVEALILQAQKPRLMWLRSAADPFKPMGDAERSSAIHARWKDVLTVLAQ